ncbi:MAG: RdgB/HAM1 family non-canonical purine NTP pyrophosphatase [Acidimicrobiia bacterium]
MTAGAPGSRRFVLASANHDKVAEIEAILAPAGVELVPRPAGVPDVDETGETLLDNARLKAAALVEVTGLPAVADDTGLAVDALGGAPGVRAARFAGPGATYGDNVAKLLAALEGVPDDRRTARFETVVLARYPDGTEVTATGVVEGHIAVAPQGEGGFGYDPIFVPVEGDGRSFAEMAPGEKHALSHRGRAFRAFVDRLGPEAGER